MKSNVTVSKLSTNIEDTVGVCGCNKKFLGRRLSDNKIGVVKFPILMESLDCINEVVCFELGKLFGFDVAEASLESYNEEDCIISCYSYKDMIYSNGVVSLRNAICDIDHFTNIFGTSWIVSNYGEKARIQFIQMLMFDYMTRQQDRHISNIAFYKESMYSLYDNGRSLFYRTEEYNDARKNVRLDVPGDIRSTFYDNEHGFTFMFLEDIVGYNEYKQYIHNNVQFDDIQKIFNKYYKDKNRANWTAKYVYSVYKILMHKKF